MSRAAAGGLDFRAAKSPHQKNTTTQRVVVFFCDRPQVLLSAFSRFKFNAETFSGAAKHNIFNVHPRF